MIIVTSQRRAEQFEPPAGERWFCISITNADAIGPELSPKFERVLRLAFDDVDPQIISERGHELYKSPMQVDDAEKIISLSEEMKRICSKTEDAQAVHCLVHCRMGVSRSNAIGRWLWRDHPCLGPITFETFQEEGWGPTDPVPEGNAHVTRVLDHVYTSMSNEARAEALDEDEDEPRIIIVPVMRGSIPFSADLG